MLKWNTNINLLKIGRKNAMEDYKRPWYFKDWFIITCSALWLLYGIPLLVAIALSYYRNKKERDIILPYQKNINKLEKKSNNIKSEIDNLITAKEQYNQEILETEKLSEEIKKQYEEEITKAKNVLEELDSDTLSSITSVQIFDDKTANELKNELSILNIEEKDLIKGNGITFSSIGQDLTKKEKNAQSKQLLRAFNSETDAFVANLTAKNVDTQRKRIVRSFEQLNKLFGIDNVSLSKKFLELKLKKLDLTYNYRLQKEREKELLKAQKEEIKEQQRAEKEIANRKKQVQKESTQFNNELKKMLEYMSKADSDVEKNIYGDKIRELEEKVKELEGIKKDIEVRETNTRAGFVYIISNIGSLGENIYKIGMTRRLEPRNRINELSSASVPFKFDIHALIFSEDAPKLESTLHNHFKEYEVNKVNTRKEFFKVDLKAIKDVVYEKFDKTVNFLEIPEAEEYYESLKLIENNENLSTDYTS